MPDIKKFLAKQRQAQIDHEEYLQGMFANFLGEVESLQDLIELWKCALNQDQAKQLYQLFRTFLEKEVAQVKSLEGLDATWHPIWNLPFRGDNEPFRASDLDDIYRKRREELSAGQI